MLIRPKFIDPWERIKRSLDRLKHALVVLEAKLQGVNTNQSLKPLEISTVHKIECMADKLDELLAEVEDETTVVDSVGTFVTGLKQQLADALAGESAATQAKVQAIIDKVHANKDKLAAAIQANT